MTASAFGPAARAAIMESHLGMCVGGCGQRAAHAHHRDARGMGGTRRPEYGQPVNGLPACERLHRWIEAHPDASRALGWMTDGVTGQEFWSPVWGGWVQWHLEPDPPTWLIAPTDRADRPTFTHP